MLVVEKVSKKVAWMDASLAVLWVDSKDDEMVELKDDDSVVLMDD